MVSAKSRRGPRETRGQIKENWAFWVILTVVLYVNSFEEKEKCEMWLHKLQRRQAHALPLSLCPLEDQSLDQGKLFKILITVNAGLAGRTPCHKTSKGESHGYPLTL